MTIRINLIPPAIIYLRHPESKDKWGRARGPVIVMAEDYSEHQHAHELFHVTQWWAVTFISAVVLYTIAYFVPAIPFGVIGLSPGVMGFLVAVSKRFRFRVEAAGYGQSVRTTFFDPFEARRYAVALSQSYGLGLSVDECHNVIMKRAHDGRWF